VENPGPARCRTCNECSSRSSWSRTLTTISTDQW
jgi:hypothetical protein